MLPSSLQRTLLYVSVHDRGCRWPSCLDSRHFFEGETLHTPQTAGLENLRGLHSGPCGSGQRVGGEGWRGVTVLSCETKCQVRGLQEPHCQLFGHLFLSVSGTREWEDGAVKRSALPGHLHNETKIVKVSMVAHVSNPSSWGAEKEIDMARVLPRSKGHTPIPKFLLRPHPLKNSPATIEPQAEHSLQNTGLWRTVKMYILSVAS